MNQNKPTLRRDRAIITAFFLRTTVQSRVVVVPPIAPSLRELLDEDSGKACEPPAGAILLRYSRSFAFHASNSAATFFGDGAPMAVRLRRA